MKTATNKEMAAELIESRDLRYYGMTFWNIQDSFLEAEKIEATQPESMVDTLRDIYRQALANMTEQEAGGIISKMKRCPPRPSHLTWKNTTTREAAMDVVEQAEIALKSFLDANYGPLWGEKQEQEYAALAAKLEGLYYEFDVPEDDRMYC